MMAGLAQSRLNSFAGKLVLKGFSTMLVPTGHRKNTIMWHLLHNKDGDRISYLEGAAIPQVNIDFSELENSRHFLGWCSEMKFYGGLNDSLKH